MDENDGSGGSRGKDGGAVEVKGCSLSNRQRMLVASVLTVLLYVCFLLACVMTCVESVKSVIKASTTPVSSTAIVFQHQKYDAPAIVLLYVANSSENSTSMTDYHCICRYTDNGGLSDTFTKTILGEFLQKKRRCEYVTDIIKIEDFYRIAIEGNHSLLYVKNEREMNRSKVHAKHYVAFTVKGPQDWERKEQVEIACYHRSAASSHPESKSRGVLNDGIEEDKVSIEYLLLPSYDEMYNHENRVHAILTHRGTKKTEFTEKSLSKTLHVYLLLSEVDEQGSKRLLLDTEESYKIVPGNSLEEGNVKFKFEWKSPMVWKIKTFIASSPWYAVTVICTMLLTLAEAVNVSKKIKMLFLGGRGVLTTADGTMSTENWNPIILKPKLTKCLSGNDNQVQDTKENNCDNNSHVLNIEQESDDKTWDSHKKERRDSYVQMMNNIPV